MTDRLAEMERRLTALEQQTTSATPPGDCPGGGVHDYHAPAVWSGPGPVVCSKCGKVTTGSAWWVSPFAPAIVTK